MANLPFDVNRYWRAAVDSNGVAYINQDNNWFLLTTKAAVVVPPNAYRFLPRPSWSDSTGTALLKPDGTATMLAGGTGRLLNFVTITLSGTYTPTAGATNAYIQGCAAGGGGGGVLGGLAAYGAAGGGAAGGAGSVHLATLNGPYTVTIGTGGAGGSGATPAAGSAGGDTTIVDNSSVTVFWVTGGGGGQPCTSGATPQSILGGIEGGVTTADYPLLASGGGIGITQGVAGSNLSGYGGSTAFGAGGRPVNVTAGRQGAGKGGGGGGAASSNNATNRNGGNGNDGIIFIWEYS